MTTPVEITDPQRSGPQFDTYAQYLEWIKDKWTEYEELRAYLSDINNRSNPKGFVHVNDILSDGSIHRPLGSHWYRPSDSNSTLSTEESLRTALSTCLIGTRTRMIFVQQAWNMAGNGLHPSIIDAIGLAFDVEPLFFSLAMKADQEAVPRHPKFLRIGSIWVKVLDNVTIGLAKPLIILVLCPHGREIDSITCEFLFRVNETPSLHHQHLQWAIHPGTAMLDACETRICTYRNGSSEEDLLRCLTVIARMHLALFQSRVDSIHVDFERWKRKEVPMGFSSAVDREKPYDDTLVYHDWCSFREHLEKFQASVRALSRFVTSCCGPSINLDNSATLHELQIDQDETIIEAKALENEMRDRLLVKAASYRLGGLE